MITKESGNQIKAIIGSNFLEKISARLIKKKITNQKGGKLSDPFISLLLNGERVHEAAEKEIWNFSEELLMEQEKEKQRQEDILKRHKALNDEK